MFMHKQEIFSIGNNIPSSFSHRKMCYYKSWKEYDQEWFLYCTNYNINTFLLTGRQTNSWASILCYSISHVVKNLSEQTFPEMQYNGYCSAPLLQKVQLGDLILVSKLFYPWITQEDHFLLTPPVLLACRELYLQV